jgi:hypothetical protein
MLFHVHFPPANISVLECTSVLHWPTVNGSLMSGTGSLLLYHKMSNTELHQAWLKVKPCGAVADFGRVSQSMFNYVSEPVNCIPGVGALAIGACVRATSQIIDYQGRFHTRNVTLLEAIRAQLERGGASALGIYQHLSSYRNNDASLHPRSLHCASCCSVCSRVPPSPSNFDWLR